MKKVLHLFILLSLLMVGFSSRAQHSSPVIQEPDRAARVAQPDQQEILIPEAPEVLASALTEALDQNDQVKAQAAARNLIRHLGEALEKRDGVRILGLVQAMRQANVKVEMYGDSYLVRFPRAVWKGMRKAPSGDGLQAASDFCYGGWVLIDESSILQIGCTSYHRTYYCAESNSILNCSTLCGTLESCGEQIFLMQ